MKNIIDGLKKINLKDRQTKKKFILITLAVVIVIIVIGRTTGTIQKVLFKKKPGEVAKGAMVGFEGEAIPVKAYKVKKTDFKDTLPVIGNIKGFKEIDLQFQVMGVVESINFEEGERIQEGDIIASLDQRDALLKLKYAEVELKKNQQLYDIGAINPVKLEQSKLEYESAKSDLDKTNLYAIADGMLGSKDRDVGSLVTPNEISTSKIGIFVSVDKVYAEFNIIEKDVHKVAIGQKVDVFCDAYPTKTFGGTIDRLAPIIEGRSRTEMLRVELDNRDGLLKPGMFVRALIYTYEKKDAIVIPTSALKKKEQEYFVYVIHKDEPKPDVADAEPEKKEKKGFSLFGMKKKEAPAAAEPEAAEPAIEFGTVEIRPIKPGYTTQDLIEVDEGLQEGELIVTEVQEEFKDKAPVEIAEVVEGLV